MATLFAYGVGGLVTGAVFIEKIFGWHGMGEWVVQGIATQDTNIIAADHGVLRRDHLLAGLLSDVIYARARPEGAGVMTEPVTTDAADDGASPASTQHSSRHGAPWCCAGSCATGPRWSR